MLFTGRQVIDSLRSTQPLTNCQPYLPLKLRRVGIFASLPSPIARYYATDRPVSRPKAHTGRPTSTRKPKDAAAPKKATSTAAKTSTAAAKKSTPPKKPKTRAKTKTKSRTNTKTKTKTKTKAKPKPKPKPKKKVRKILTEKQKADVAAKKKRSDLKALKELALKTPTGKPFSAWLVLCKDKGNGAPSTSLATEYKNLSTERREHYNHIANQNRAANAIQYRQWIESHPVDVIHKANQARKLMRRRGTKNSAKWPKLHDDREVKGPTGAYLRFYMERLASGDFGGIVLAETAKRASQEWKELPALQKQPYFDSAKQDSARYAQEIKTVYNRDV